MRVLVVGATGVLGRHVVPRLVERGHTVCALVRDETAARHFASMGVELMLGDIFHRSILDHAAVGCDAALHLATAIPRRPPLDWSRNDLIRREGTRHLLAASQAAGVRRYVQQSIIFLYGERGEAIVDESAVLRADSVTQSAAEMEEQVRASGLDWCILRGGSFYGPGTDLEARWRADARAGTNRLPGDGAGWVSLVHVIDMARAVVVAAEHAAPGSVFNIVDDDPVRYRDLYAFVASQEGAAGPQAGGPITRSLRCSNAAARAALNWEPLYPTYRSGLA